MKLMSQGLWRTIAVLAVIFAMSAFVFGQAELGAIAGVVKDSTGAVVADAKVTATLTSTNAEHSATSNSLGEYHLQNLTPGTYSVVVSKSGFQTYKTTMEVAVGAHATLDASLTVGSGSTVVEVVAGAATEINTQTQELSQLIDTQQLAQLPSLTRNPYDFVAISGNVSNGDTTSNGGMGGGQELSSRGVGFAINGQRESGTEILLDGVENVSVFGVSVGENIPLDGVQEYSVVTNNFSAEYGRASGGVVNVTTKTGTNAWHGSAWEFNRLAAYTANTFNNVANGLPKGQYTRNQFGFQVGGPDHQEQAVRFREHGVDAGSQQFRPDGRRCLILHSSALLACQMRRLTSQFFGYRCVAACLQFGRLTATVAQLERDHQVPSVEFVKQHVNNCHADRSLARRFRHCQLPCAIQ